MHIKSNFIPIELYNKYVGNDPKLINKNISIFNDYTPTLEELSINEINILIIQEPNEFFGLHDWALENQKYFSCILTWGEKILNNCSNSLLLPFGTTYLHKNNVYKQLSMMEKKFELSFLCGKKQIIEGHHFRHKLYNNQSQVKNIPLKWYYTYDGPKDICFETSMFHLAVENSKNKNYFTEKIIDAFITKTIPIYWGCPNISEYFDERGFFIINSYEDFINLTNSLTEDDYYSRIEYIEKNYETGLYYALYFDRVRDIIKQIVSINNL